MDVNQLENAKELKNQQLQPKLSEEKRKELTETVLKAIIDEFPKATVDGLVVPKITIHNYVLKLKIPRVIPMDNSED